MHENREISCTSCSKEQDRSAKAINRTADMHVQEKSDCAVVPVNLSNKEAQASAESGEGRAQTKENIVQSHKLPTQSGKGLSQGLRGVRQAARERKQERFTALLHHLNIGLLRDSFYALKRQASPGIDGVTWQEYETGLEDRLTDLLSRVHRGVYRAQPSRRVYIPKADGRQRPLGVAALEDKIVQQALVAMLNQIYEVDFKGFSYRVPTQAQTGNSAVRENRGPLRFWVSLTTAGSATVTELSSSGGLRRRGGWPRSSKPSRRSFNVGSIIARPRLVHGSARLCWATTNTMLFRATRHSCASLLVAFAGCGELYSYVAVNVHRWGGIDSIHS